MTTSEAEAAANAELSAENHNNQTAGDETPATTNTFTYEGESFDPERAMKTIANQRESENALKAKLKAYEDAENEAAEAKKSAETKLAERDLKIQELEKAAAFRDAEDHFKSEATEAGVENLTLALLVARDQGLLGEYNPKTGNVEVGKVDFDKLLDEYPELAGGSARRRDSGDAGRIGRSTNKTLNQQFNDRIRGR